MADAISIWPVVVGGLIAMGGVAITTGVNVAMKFVENRDQTKKRRAEKFEELVEKVYEFDHWQELKSAVRVYGTEEKIEVSPLAKIEAISAVNFPEFATAIKILVRTARDYDLWMSDAGQRRLAGDMAHVNDGLLVVYEPYIGARDALLDELKEFARREFQALTE